VTYYISFISSPPHDHVAPRAIPYSRPLGDFSNRTCQALRSNGADVSAHGEAFGSALHAASSETEIVRFLLSNGADVNSPGGLSGNALQVADEFVPEIIPLILDSGEDVDYEKGFGWAGSALEAAVSKDHRDIVELLLEHGAVERRVQ